IESLVYAIRSAAVFIPNALGVQEGAYVLLGPLFGVATDTALAISVLKRARDIAIGVPVLLIWQAAEGRRAVSRSAVRPRAGDGPVQVPITRNSKATGTSSPTCSVAFQSPGPTP